MTSLPLDPPAAPRAQPVLLLAPLDARTVVGALRGALPRVQAGVPGVQLLVVVPEAELAVETASLAAGGMAAFTSNHRGARLLSSAAPSVIAASMGDTLALVRGAQLKLDALVAIVVAGVDVLLARDADALDALLAEVPAGALRVATAARDSEALTAFAERHLRRARREGVEQVPPGEPLATPVHGLVVGAGARAAVLRSLLDAFDPPSAAIVVDDDADAQEVRSALAPVGLSGDEPLAAVVTAVQVPANVALLVSWRLPTDAAALTALAATTPVRLVVLHEAGERARLLAVARGAIAPLDLPMPLDGLRRRDALLRAELERELTTGAPLREAQVLAPLLAAHDGLSIAAAVVRILERDRAQSHARRVAAASALAATAAAASATPRPERSETDDRGGRSERPPRPAGNVGDRDSRPPRSGGKFGDRESRPPRSSAKFGDREGRPPRAGGKFGDRDSRPARGGSSGGSGSGSSRGGSRDGKFGDKDARGPRPPRAGGKFGDRDSSGPRGPVRESRGPSEGGDRKEWTDRGEAMRRAKRPPRGE